MHYEYSKPAKQATLHHWKERIIRKYGMQLHGQLPLVTVQVNRDAAETRRRHAAETYPNQVKAREEHERSYLAEYAFHLLLQEQSITHDWTEYGYDPADFTLADGTTIDVHSGYHRDMLTYHRHLQQPLILYPLDKQGRLCNYVLGISVIGLRSRVAWVAVWGLIARDDLAPLLASTRFTEFVGIPLTKFESKPLEELIGEVDPVRHIAEREPDWSELGDR
jgi:hypothetical protein